jgi:hypothetical protein
VRNGKTGERIGTSGRHGPVGVLDRGFRRVFGRTPTYLDSPAAENDLAV